MRCCSDSVGTPWVGQRIRTQMTCCAGVYGLAASLTYCLGHSWIFCLGNGVKGYILGRGPIVRRQVDGPFNEGL